MSNRSKDRSSLCSFMFVDGRKCRIPRRVDHPYLCAFHARKEAQTLAGERAAPARTSPITFPAASCPPAISAPPSDASSPLSLKVDRKSTRLNSSHLVISYAVFCLKKK